MIEVGTRSTTLQRAAEDTDAPFFRLYWIIHAILASILWAPVVRDMAMIWWTDPAASHGLLIPPFAAYLAWSRRDVTLSKRASIDNRGLLMIAAACVALLAGKLAAEYFLQRLSLVIFIAGIAWTYWGLRRLATLKLPLLLLTTMIPLPALVYGAMSARLQLLSSQIAANVAEWFGISVYLEGNVIHLATVSLGVAEACSGLRSLTSLVIGALLIGVLRLRRLRARALLILLAVPIAIAGNVFRVSGTAVLVDYDPQLALGFFHTFTGWLVFVAGMGMLLGCASLLNRVLETRE